MHLSDTINSAAEIVAAGTPPPTLARRRDPDLAQEAMEAVLVQHHQQAAQA